MKRLITSKDLDMFRTNETAVKNALRENRDIFFRAYDVYKTDVIYAPEIHNETPEEHKQVVAWHLAAERLEEWACMIDGVPKKIKDTYLKKYVKAVVS